MARWPMRRAGLMLASALIAGCGLLPSVPPDWVTNRQPLESCGNESVDHGGSFDVEARECLLSAFEGGRDGELISTRRTVEGAPITRYLRVHENGTIEVIVDATRDQFGSGRWERLLCERLVPVAEFNDPPDLVFVEDEVFIEDGCQAAPIP